MVEVGPIRIVSEGQKIEDFGDDYDLSYLDSKLKRWTIEVKGRALDFTCAADYPFETIFIDRAGKSDKYQPHYYFIVNKAKTHAAIIAGSTRKKWHGPNTYMDSVKGYRVSVFECPKELATFKALQ